MTFSDQDKSDVWKKGEEIPGKDPDNIRKDACGSEINREDYGNRDSDQGWEIDHIKPDGGDDISNLRPMQWKNNVDKSDGNSNCGCSSKED